LIRSTNASQQYDRGLSPAFYDTFGWLSKYAFVYANMEMFSMDEPSHDIIGDGYNSLLNRLLLRYNIVEYSSSAQSGPVDPLKL